MEMENTAVETTTTSTEEKNTFTMEEVQALIQSEADKRVSQALKTQEKKFEQRYSLSKLDDSEREKAERDIRIQELEGMVKEFQTEKNRSELKSVLSSRGLSAEFADIVAIGEDIETAQANIDKLDKLFKAAVKAEVEKRLASNTPKGNVTKEEVTKDSLKKMSMAQLNELARTNPTLFNELINS